jgi:hypothetical protein
MADFVYTPTERSRARSRRRELTQDAPLLARLDWVMLAAVAGIVLYGLWGIDGITRNDVPGSPNYYPTARSRSSSPSGWSASSSWC